MDAPSEHSQPGEAGHWTEGRGPVHSMIDSVSAPPVAAATIGELRSLHEQILSCRKCELAGLLWEAHPVAGGRATARVMVIGQAPGVRTMRAGKHFSGPGGKLLREWIAQGGIPHERQEREVYFSSLTRCFPGPSASGAGDRKPSPAEIDLCAPYQEREFRLLDPVLVLLVGSMAIERYLGRAPLRQVVGTLVEANSRSWLPLPHPSGVSRWLNDPKHRALVAAGLEQMRRLIASAGWGTTIDTGAESSFSEPLATG